MSENGEVDLDALVSTKRVKLGGNWLPIKDLDGVGYQLLRKLREAGTGGESVDIMYQIAALSLPIPESEVLKLSAVQVGAVVELAASKVNAVEATIPKERTARKKGATSP